MKSVTMDAQIINVTTDAQIIYVPQKVVCLVMDLL